MVAPIVRRTYHASQIFFQLYGHALTAFTSKQAPSQIMKKLSHFMKIMSVWDGGKQMAPY